VAQCGVLVLAAAERRAVVLGITGDLAFAAGALVAGLARHGLDPATTILIFHDCLDPAAEAAFRRLWARVAFRPYDRAHMLARLGLRGGAGRLGRVLERFSPLVLAKLELPDLLAEYDRCVWLDADMLVQGSPGGLWEFGAMAWRPLPGGALHRRKDVFQALGLSPGDEVLPMLNGGAVGMSRAMAAQGSDRLYALARDLLERTSSQTPDEMALYLLAVSGGVPVTLWPLALNHPVQAPGSRGAVLVHAIGPYKFWNATPLIQLYPEWAEHHAAWIEAGGAPFAGPVHLEAVHPLDPGEVMRRVARRADWLALHDRLRPDLPAGVQFGPRLDGDDVALTLAGRPDDQVIRLSRHANPRRIGIDIALPERSAALAALRLAVPDLREEGRMSVAQADLARTLQAVAGVLWPRRG
jgi:hypothetical protein